MTHTLTATLNTQYVILHLQETEAVAMGEDWKLELKPKEMQQAKVGHAKR